MGMGWPKSIYHLVGKGTTPSKPNQGNRNDIGKYGKPVNRAKVDDFPKVTYVSSAPTIATGIIGA